MPNAFLLYFTGEALQVTTKQPELGINAITSLLYNPTQIAHDSKYTLYHCPFSNSTCFILSLI